MTGLGRKRHPLLPLMLALAVILTGLLFLATSCDGGVLELGEAIQGSGSLATHDYPFADFTEVDVSSAFVVTITASDEYAVSITADDNILDLVEVRNTDNNLTIGLDGSTRVRDVTLRATITMPALTWLNVSGATRATVSGFSSTDNLVLGASGASGITGDITAGVADFAVSGASKIELEGTASELVADVSGASHLLLSDFLVTHADLVISGASEGVVNLTGRLDADVSGASHLEYSGEPTMGDINTSGASSLSPQ